jgi:hypothetical protein
MRLSWALGALALVSCTDAPKAPTPTAPGAVEVRAPRPVSSAAVPSEEPSTSPGLVPLPTSTAALRAALDDRYRLRPDARVMRAVSDVHHLVTGQSPRDASATWGENRWRLIHGGAVVGTLSEFPDFPEIITLLSTWASSVATTGPSLVEPPASPPPTEAAAGSKRGGGSKAPKVPPAPPQAAGDADAPPLAMSPEAFAMLRLADEAWSRGPLKAVVLHEAALAMASLSFQAADSLGVADALPARALATVAIEETLKRTDPKRAQALTAFSLGYANAARQLAQSLPPTDALRAYLLTDDAALWRAAERESSPLAVRYLAARHRADLGRLEVDDPHPWIGNGGFGLPILLARVAARRSEEVERGRLAAPAIAALEVAAATGDATAVQALANLDEQGQGRKAKAKAKASPRRGPAKTPGNPLRSALEAARLDGGLLDRFEANLGKLEGGRILNAVSRRAYYEGAFFTALARMADSDRPTAESADEGHLILLRAASSTAWARGEQFLRWSRLRREAKSGRAEPRQVLETLGSTGPTGALGGTALAELYEAIADREDARGAAPAVVRTLVAHLDARPTHRQRLAGIALRSLDDLRLWEKFSRAFIEADSGTETEAQAVLFAGEWSQANQLLGSTRLAPQRKAEVIRALHSAGQLSEEEATAALRALLRAEGDDWPLRDALIELLERQERHADARKVIREWEARALQPSGASAALARQLEKEGRLDEAWQAIAGAVETWNPAVTRRAVLIQLARGKHAEAERLARAGLERHPGFTGVDILIEVLWRASKPLDAAALLASQAWPMTKGDWQDLGATFARVFATHAREPALAATEALTAAGIDPLSLRQLADASVRAGDPSLAFSILSGLRHGSPLGHVELQVAAYQALKQARDDTAAFDWLVKAVTPSGREGLALRAFSAGAPELLWTAVPVPTGSGQSMDLVWLLRALASLRDTTLDPARRDEVRRNAEAPGASHYHQLTRHALGLADEKSVLELASASPRAACEIAFWVGAKAEAEGRLADASDWYRAATESGLEPLYEYREAQARLLAWRARGLNLARLGAVLGRAGSDANAKPAAPE